MDALRWHDGCVTELLEGARRLVVVGDEFVAGFGDPRALGWVGRVAARSQTGDGEPLLTLQLAVPEETTTALAARWERELAPRLGERTWLVVAPGAGDLAAGTSLARSRLNLANILDAAAGAHLPVFVVGPAPRTDLARARQQELSGAFADVCGRRRVPYVETFAPLVDHDQWAADLAANDGVHPGQAGYGLLAWLVLHHDWYDWLGIPAPA